MGVTKYQNVAQGYIQDVSDCGVSCLDHLPLRASSQVSKERAAWTHSRLLTDLWLGRLTSIRRLSSVNSKMEIMVHSSQGFTRNESILIKRLKWGIARRKPSAESALCQPHILDQSSQTLTPTSHICKLRAVPARGPSQDPLPPSSPTHHHPPYCQPDMAAPLPHPRQTHPHGQQSPEWQLLSSFLFHFWWNLKRKL